MSILATSDSMRRTRTLYSVRYVQLTVMNITIERYIPLSGNFSSNSNVHLLFLTQEKRTDVHRSCFSTSHSTPSFRSR